MKNFILFASLSVFSVNSFAEFTMTCTEMYHRTMVDKAVKRNRADKIATNAGGAGAILSISGAPFVGLGILVAAAGTRIYADSASKEEKIMRMTEEGNNQLIKLTNRLQKKIHSDISSGEVLALLEEGLKSGRYCQDFPRLYSPVKIKDLIGKQLQLKYGPAQ